MDSTGITPTYNVGGNGDGFGGVGMFLFGILALLLFGGNGAFNGGAGNSNAIQADVNRGFDNQNLQAQTRDVLAAVTSGTAQSVAATNQVYHDTVSAINDKYGELQRDIAGIAVGQANALANANQCCCETKMLIQQTSAANALAMAQMEARLTAKMDGNEIQALRDQVSELKTQNMFCGIPRISPYGYGVYPYANFAGGNL